MKEITHPDQNPKITEALNRLGDKRRFWIANPKGIDSTKPEEEEEMPDIFQDDLDSLEPWDEQWDDNEQHTEQGI